MERCRKREEGEEGKGGGTFVKGRVGGRGGGIGGKIKRGAVEGGGRVGGGAWVKCR